MPKDKRRRTIDTKLLAEWGKLARKGDPEKLAALLKVSKPTIDKALIYGSVQQQRIVDGINNYFAERLLEEAKQGDRFETVRQLLKTT